METLVASIAAALLTGRPGSSAWYLGGIVAYSNDLKLRLLGVPADVLAAQGAVSLAVAEAMAAGARAAVQADFAVAITGIAGPDGGTKDKPVGLVYVGVAAPHGTAAFKHHLSGSRADVRNAAAEAALRHLLEAVES